MVGGGGWAEGGKWWGKCPIERLPDTDSIFRLYRMIQSSISRSDFCIVRLYRHFFLKSQFFSQPILFWLEVPIFRTVWNRFYHFFEVQKYFLAVFISSQNKFILLNGMHSLVQFFPKISVYRCRFNETFLSIAAHLCMFPCSCNFAFFSFLRAIIQIWLFAYMSSYILQGK